MTLAHFDEAVITFDAIFFGGTSASRDENGQICVVLK